AVAPGFIDIHSHGDGSLWDDPRAESVVRQGVTTIVVGQDGSSRAPTGGVTADGESEKGGHAFASFDQFWQSLKTLQPGVNVASIAVAPGENCPLQISHLKTQGPRNSGKLDDVFARIHRARGGLDIASTYSGESRKAPPSAAKRGKAAPARGRPEPRPPSTA